MVNSHYVPQFILRNFYGKNNQITYCDLAQEKTESRNTRSVFSEIGYYPDELEKDLCKNMIKPPKVRRNTGKKEYHYDVYRKTT